VAFGRCASRWSILGMRVYPDMFSLAQAHQAFKDDGRLRNEVLQKRRGLKKQWVEFLGEHPDVVTDNVETSSMDVA
jgi:hypothetical protein